MIDIGIPPIIWFSPQQKKRGFCCNELQQSLATWAAMPGINRTDDITNTEISVSATPFIPKEIISRQNPFYKSKFSQKIQLTIPINIVATYRKKLQKKEQKDLPIDKKNLPLRLESLFTRFVYESTSYKKFKTIE